MNINKLNLNLILTLNALLNAKNVTIASRQIGVSQSSMSEIALRYKNLDYIYKYK